MTSSLRSLVNQALHRGAVLRGEAIPDGPVRRWGEEDRFAARHVATAAAQEALLERLAVQFPLLRDSLLGAKVEGRRLFQGGHEAARLRDVQAPAAAILGSPILGLDMDQCSSICVALTNETHKSSECVAFVYRLASSDYSSLELAECWLVASLGACSAMDFAVSGLLDRRSADLCTGLVEGELRPRCVALVPGRGVETRVLTAGQSAEACTGGRNAPSLFWPRSSLEAFSAQGYARERGIVAFFSGRPPLNSSVITTYWSADDGTEFVIPANDGRCVLVESESELDGALFARMAPCTEPLADGIICESFNSGSRLATPPPPPPSVYESSLRSLADTTIRGLTQAVCASPEPAGLCVQVANLMATPVRAGILASVVPLCEPVCWPGCSSNAGEGAGFDDCTSAGCADRPCLDFLINECIGVDVWHLHQAVCAADAHAARPPPPPSQPPAPPAPPPVEVGLVDATSEAGLADCEEASYADCMEHARSSNGGRLDLRLEECAEAKPQLGEGCFLGCSLGGDAAAVFSYARGGLTPFHTRRCADAPLPLCLCRLAAPPPPPRVGTGGIASWAGLDDSATGGATGFFEVAAVGSLPERFFVNSTSQYSCDLDDPGAHTCARTCAATFPTAESLLFSVQGTAAPPSAPPPSPPPASPDPPSSPPLPPGAVRKVYLSSDACANAGIIDFGELTCRDSGVGSQAPHVCSYGSQVIPPHPCPRRAHGIVARCILRHGACSVGS